VLRWALQRGTGVIPKTSREHVLKENIDLFDFSLAESEMAEVGSLNKNRIFNDPGVFCENEFNLFFPVFE
jgi:D-xylose reductase